MRGAPFSYGHALMASGPDVSAMFPTWFRTLSLAVIAQALPDLLPLTPIRPPTGSIGKR
jgi:hypothetical protein